MTAANAAAVLTRETIEVALRDASVLERVVGLVARNGCAYDRVLAERDGDHIRISVTVTGNAAAIRRLRGHYARLLDDDKEMSR